MNGQEWIWMWDNLRGDRNEEIGISIAHFAHFKCMRDPPTDRPTGLIKKRMVIVSYRHTWKTHMWRHTWRSRFIYLCARPRNCSNQWNNLVVQAYPQFNFLGFHPVADFLTIDSEKMSRENQISVTLLFGRVPCQFFTKIFDGPSFRCRRVESFIIPTPWTLNSEISEEYTFEHRWSVPSIRDTRYTTSFHKRFCSL